MKNKFIIVCVMPCMMLGACTGAQVDRMKWVGKEPPMQEMKDPSEGKQPVKWPLEQMRKSNVKASSNSLWGNSSKDYFRDQRARKIGDILMVNVSIKDKANFDNKTERSRSSSEGLGAPNLFGVEKLATAFLPGKADTSKLLSVSGDMKNTGEGVIEREEEITTDVSAVVTQVMNNGNMVIYGSQEVRVNHEIRQLTIEGVIRPGDISPQNTVESKRIAEARISYGGRGLISDVQQPRVGSQIIDILSPW